MHASLMLRSAGGGEPPAMAIVRQMLKAAMRTGNAAEKNTLKAVMAAVKNSNIAKPGSCSSDLSFSGVLNSLIKKRLDSAAEYAKGNRKDLADTEHGEVAILTEVLKKLDIATPEQLQSSVTAFLKKANIDLGDKDSFKKVMSSLPKDVEELWKSPKSSVVDAVKQMMNQKRGYATSAHENPLGLRRRSRAHQQPTGKRRIPGVKRVVLVSSAKGGVGKSTVAVNLAAELHKQGFSTGVLDVDIFGPSLPKLLNLESNNEPRLTEDGARLLPLQNHGLKAMSMGFLVPPGKSVSWRGLLVQKALQQLLFEVEWGPTEFLVVDMPPGTGDVQLTIGQQLEIDGAVLVTTPQDVALIDAERGADLFKLLKVPVLGIVENMSVFVCPCCNTPTKIFGSSSEKLNQLGFEVLAQIPLLPDIAQAADRGRPTATQNYAELAERVVQKLSRNR